MVNLSSEYSTGLCFEGQISVKFSRTWLNEIKLVLLWGRDSIFSKTDCRFYQ